MSNAPKPMRVPRNLRQEITNIPNMLTLGRVAVIPVIIYLLLAHRTPQGSFWAAVLFSLAAITDFLDGWLARNIGLESVLGKFLDPLADKLVVMSVLVCMVDLGRIPVWLVVLLLARELSISGLRSIASQEGLTLHVVQAGKLKTALQLVGLIAMLIGYRYEFDFIVAMYEVDFTGIGLVLVGFSMVFSLMSAFSYFRSFAGAIGERNQKLLGGEAASDGR